VSNSAPSASTTASASPAPRSSGHTTTTSRRLPAFGATAALPASASASAAARRRISAPRRRLNLCARPRDRPRQPSAPWAARAAPASAATPALPSCDEAAAAAAAAAERGTSAAEGRDDEAAAPAPGCSSPSDARPHTRTVRSAAWRTRQCGCSRQPSTASACRCTSLVRTSSLDAPTKGVRPAASPRSADTSSDTAAGPEASPPPPPPDAVVPVRCRTSAARVAGLGRSACHTLHTQRPNR
jgi:hypothetical protein